jgi:hypothetical protein
MFTARYPVCRGQSNGMYSPWPDYGNILHETSSKASRFYPDSGLIAYLKDFSKNRHKSKDVTMLPESREIMEIFRRFKIGKGETLQRSDLERIVSTEWDRGLQDKLSDGLNELVKMEYIRMGGDRGFYLVDRGYNYLYVSTPYRRTSK